VLAVGLLSAGVALALYAPDALRRFELQTVDARFSLRGERPPDDDIVVVAIDAQSFEVVGRYPFPRSAHGRVIDNLNRAGADVIGYDVQFTEASTPREDLALAKAIDRSEAEVVLVTTEVEAGTGDSQILGGDRNLERIGALPSIASAFVIDPGGVYRRFVHTHLGLETFPVVVREVESREQVPPSAFDRRGAWVDFAGPPETYPTISFADVYRDDFPEGAFRDKTVMVGASAPSLNDVHATSFSGGRELMAGPEVHANALDSLRRGLPLRGSSSVVDVLLIALFGLGVPAGTLLLRSAWLSLAAVPLGLAALLIGGVQLAFNAGLILPLVYPGIALLLSAVGTLGFYYFVSALERQRTRNLFARFVPETVVDKLLAEAGDDLRLGGTRKHCTLLFSDLRSFTTASELLEPEAVIEIVNRYLSVMTEAILAHGGTLITYMGDGIMALFGAPLDQPDHADRAIATAREMVGPRLTEFNCWMREQGFGEGFRMGVGINSGPVMVGNVGSERRMDYTAIGDTVNTASRIEGMTKGTPHMIYISDSTHAMLTRETPDLFFVDELPVRGRQRAVQVWSVPDGGGPAA
jgi:adenylate cyclase